MAMTRPTSDQIAFQNAVARPGQLAVDTNTPFIGSSKPNSAFCGIPLSDLQHQ